MPQVRLTVQDDGGRTLPNSTGGTVYLPQHRLRIWVRLGRAYAARQAIVDTGAPACIFSKQVWDAFHARNDIVWVAHPPTDTDRTALPRVDVHGGNYPFRLGRIRLEPVNLTEGQLAPRDVLVICTEDEPVEPENDPPELPRLLLVGLVEVMNGRSLQLQISADGLQRTALLSEP